MTSVEALPGTVARTKRGIPPAHAPRRRSSFETLASSAAVLVAITLHYCSSSFGAGPERGSGARGVPGRQKKEVWGQDADPRASLETTERVVSSFDKTSCLWLVPPDPEDVRKRPKDLFRELEVRLQVLARHEAGHKVDATEAMFASMARTATALAQASAGQGKNHLMAQCRILNMALDLLWERGRGPLAGIGYHVSGIAKANAAKPDVRELLAKYLLVQRRNLVTHAHLYRCIHGGGDDRWMGVVERESKAQMLGALEKLYRESIGISRARAAIYLIEGIMLSPIDEASSKRANTLVKQYKRVWKADKYMNRLAKKRIGTFLVDLESLIDFSVVLMDGTDVTIQDLSGNITLIVFFEHSNVEHFEYVRKNTVRLTEGKAVVIGVPVGSDTAPKTKPSIAKCLADPRKLNIPRLLKTLNVRAVPWYVLITPKLGIIGGHTTKRISEYLAQAQNKERPVSPGSSKPGK